MKVRKGAEWFISKVRDIIFRDLVKMFTSEYNVFSFKLFKVRRLMFFIPLIFTFTTISLVQNGQIGATFFPDIPPDFFNIEVAFNPGDTKVKTKGFVEKASTNECPV